MNNKRTGNLKNLSFESRISLTAMLAVLIPLVIFAVISIYSSSQALTDVIKKELEDKSVLVAYNIDNFISERIIDAKLLSQADVLEGGIIPDIIQYLTEIVEENKWINDIDIIDLSGKIIASSGEQNEKGQLFVDAHPGANALYLATSKARQGEVYISEAQFLDTGPGILLMTPVTDDSNRLIVGVLTLEVNLRNIERITSLFDEGIVGDKHVYIVDKDGKVIVTKDPSVDVFNTFPDLLVHPKLLSAFSRQGDMGNIIYTDIAGDEVMAGYSDMGEFGVNNALDWSIIAIAPLDEMNAPVRMMQNWLFTTGIIIAFIAMVIIYLFINNTKIVLQKMAAQADKISLGDFSQQLPFKTQDKGALATFVIAFNRMVSNTRETMEALRGREQDLAITLDSIGDAVITTDDKGYINRMNPVAEQLTGWSMQEAKKQPLQSIFPVIDATTREITENPVEQVLATGETVYLSNHTTLIARNGTEYQIAYSAAPIRNSDDSITGIVLVFNDVTEQYHLHKKAQLAQQQLLGLFDGMQTMVGVLECDGTVIFVNNTPLIAAGIELDDVRNKKAWDCPWFNYDPKIQDLIKSDVAEANAGTSVMHDMQVAMADGLLWIEFSMHPVFNAEGKVIQVVGEGRDVSKRLQQEEQLRRSQKMDALGKITGGVAHDYNNMLGIIIGYADLLKFALSEQPKLEKYAHEIHHAAERSAKLTQKLLAFSRQKSSDAEAVNLSALLRENRHMIEKTLTARSSWNLI